jgi:hypothetical protein
MTVRRRFAYDQVLAVRQSAMPSGIIKGSPTRLVVPSGHANAS